MRLVLMIIIVLSSSCSSKYKASHTDYKKFKDRIVYILIDKEPDNLYEISDKNSDNLNTGLKRLNSLKNVAH